MATNIRYEHDCETCIYLGPYKGFDLYWHEGPADIRSLSTPIARFGKGADYTSGGQVALGDFHPELFEALNRANSLGYWI